MTGASNKLSIVEKVGYSLGDSAANFVFMTMILFQTNFYTDVFGLAAGTAAAVFLLARLWDAVVDPIVGVLADRTQSRWGKFRPWILFTAAPWCVAMVLAYTTPKGWSTTAMVAYAAITNILLMSIYSMNNMPYAALGGVMTGDVNERAKLNSYRFVAVNAAQFIVGGFTLPLVAKFAIGHDRQYGWQMTMTIWAGVCLVLFLVTFFTTRERIQPPPQQRSDIGEDVSALLANGPWIVMFAWTVVHFFILPFRGTAWYNYFHYYADKVAMYDWLQSLHLTGPAPGAGNKRLWRFTGDARLHRACRPRQPRGFQRSRRVQQHLQHGGHRLNHLLHCDLRGLGPALWKEDSRGRRVRTYDVRVLGVLSVGADQRHWNDRDAGRDLGMLTAPTIPLAWAIFADVADYSEWKTGRRITGLVFATIMFALKAGLALGSASFLWIMAGMFAYNKDHPELPETVHGFRVCSGLVVGGLFAVCTLLLVFYKLNKGVTLRMAGELAERRTHYQE